MKCPICKFENLSAGSLKFYQIDKKELNVPFYICDCAFLYYRHETVVEQYISNNKYINANTGSGASTQFDLSRLNQSVKIIGSKLKLKEGNILDVGCNNGNFIRKLMSFFQGANFFGTDLIISKIVSSDLEKLGVKVAETTDVTYFGTSKMDFISVLHVLEHVDDIGLFIEKLKAALTPDGTMYIEIPDASRYEEYFISPYSYFDLEHINHFTLMALERLFATYSLVIESSYQFDIEMSENIKYPAIGVFVKNQKEKIFT